MNYKHFTCAAAAAAVAVAAAHAGKPALVLV